MTTRGVLLAIPLLLSASQLLTGCAKPGAERPAPTTDTARLEQAHIKNLKDPVLRKAVTERNATLNLQELERKRIVDSLEFSPIDPSVLKLCRLPIPTPAAAIDPHRSLFVHDRATLDNAILGSGPTQGFRLKRTLNQIASQVSVSVPGTTAEGVFRQLWDTQNNAPGVVASSAHCNDDGSTLNGYPMSCPRTEGQEAQGTDAQIAARMDEYKVLALVNRLDLAHEGWRNCGEHRIIYGKQNGISKNLIIFEAVLPNPKPGCREGCLPVAEFWKSLSTIDSAATRAQKLEQFFYTGLPGFRPVVHVDHYSAKGVTSRYGSSGSGQVRTNQFLQGPWMLKEFKTVIDCGATPCKFQMVPIMVKVNPHGELWNEDVANNAGAMQARAQAFEADMLLQTSSLASPDMMGIGYSVDLDHDAGQSVMTGTFDNYRSHLNAATANVFRSAIATGALTSDQIANRALTQSCAGCHQPGAFGLTSPGSIGSAATPTGGTTTSWPASAPPVGFVHVDTDTTQTPPELANAAIFGAGGTGQRLSPALLDFFLPARKNFLVSELNKTRCACANRFGFLSPALRNKALAAEKRVEQTFAPRFDALKQQRAAILSRPHNAGEARAIERQGERLIAERDNTLMAELAREGIQLPPAESANLRPQVLRLDAARLAAGNAQRERQLRIQEVNKIVKEEPPRRTVTGSFRSH